MVETASGKTEVKTPEELGAKRLSDGSVAVKDKTNRLKVLPSTGDTKASFLVVLGLSVFGFVTYCYRKSLKKVLSRFKRDN